ncbi:flagellar assembly protein FliH [Methylomonas sp. AM2-LC]|uniref:flagellar assembly protein FliH n=1 Tax=Methylomonas sp. AM2-LC TaxID=3153301 RepID=UPI003266B494
MSSSKTANFTEAELLSLHTWTTLQELGGHRSEPIEPSEAPRTLTVEEIEAMQKQAYDEAFQQGRQEGFEQGRTEGFAEGEKQGLESGRKQGYLESEHLLQKQAAELVLLMESLSEPFRELDAAVEKELVKLTIAIASQIIRREIKLDPGQIVAVIREAIKVLPLSAQKITLNLHPEDAELVRAALNLDDSMPQWRLLENPLLTRGGCTIETDTSYIDASLENRLSAVVANVLGGERQQDVAS